MVSSMLTRTWWILRICYSFAPSPSNCDAFNSQTRDFCKSSIVVNIILMIRSKESLGSLMTALLQQPNNIWLCSYEAKALMSRTDNRFAWLIPEISFSQTHLARRVRRYSHTIRTRTREKRKTSAIRWSLARRQLKITRSFITYAALENSSWNFAAFARRLDYYPEIPARRQLFLPLNARRRRRLRNLSFDSIFIERRSTAYTQPRVITFE